MTEVSVHIEAILMMTDESALGLQFGRNYQIRKLSLGELKNKEFLCNGTQKVSYEYHQSILGNEEVPEFIVIEKDDSLEIDVNPPKCPCTQVGGMIQVSYTEEVAFYTPPELNAYKDEEYQYLNDVINMLKLSKVGNIGFKDVFFDFEWSKGIEVNKRPMRQLSATRNFLDNRVYSLLPSEIVLCNTAISRITSDEFRLLRQPIEQFSWALEQVDKATGLLMFITTLEMMLVHRKENFKSELLAKRCAVIAYTDDVNMKKTFNLMKDLYRFRSEYVHAGKDNICSQNLSEAEELSRHLLKIILEEAKCFLDTKPNKDFHQFKSNLVKMTTRKVKRAEKRQVFR